MADSEAHPAHGEEWLYTLRGRPKPIGELVLSGSDAALRQLMGGGARVPEDWDDDVSVF